MSNKVAVNNFLARMKSLGFRTLSFLVHKDDEDNVREYVSNLKSEKLKAMTITPSDTITRLDRLALSDAQFSLVHHFDRTTVSSHVKYLDGRSYQRTSNNYVVAKRLDYIESQLNDGRPISPAIELAIQRFPMNAKK